MNYQSVFRPGLLAGRCMLVTAGGSGIGGCTAHELASVARVGRRIRALEAVAAELAECPPPPGCPTVHPSTCMRPLQAFPLARAPDMLSDPDEGQA